MSEEFIPTEQGMRVYQFVASPKEEPMNDKAEHEASDPIKLPVTLGSVFGTFMDADGVTVSSEQMLAAINERPQLLAETLRLRQEVEGLRKALTPSPETKWDYSGEFAWEEDETRDGETYESVTRTVPWTVIKRIMARIRERAALGHEVEA